MSRFAIALLALFLGIVSAYAQAIVADPKPRFEISGWSYKPLPQDVHGYSCQTQCVLGSSVSYRLYGSEFDTSMTIEQFREQQRQAVKMLQEYRRVPAGAKIELVAVTEKKIGTARLLESQRLTTLADGQKQHAISSFMFGYGTPFSLISSGPDEAATKTNFVLFLAAVMAVAKGTESR